MLHDDTMPPFSKPRRLFVREQMKHEAFSTEDGIAYGAKLTVSSFLDSRRTRHCHQWSYQTNLQKTFVITLDTFTFALLLLVVHQFYTNQPAARHTTLFFGYKIRSKYI
jgi:hypothetical protein